MNFSSISAVRYADAEEKFLLVSDAGGVAACVPWPSSTWHRELVFAWLAVGNEIAPYVAPVSTGPWIYSKAKLFDAMSDGEFATWKFAESGFPARHLAIFNHAAEVSSDHHLFTVLRNAMVAAYGEDRTDELFIAAET